MSRHDGSSDLFAGVPQRVLNAAVYFVFVLIGCAYIVAAKSTGMPAVAVTLFPVAIMIGYCALTYWVRRIRLREDQIGDNAYYIGLLYTLTSLAMSLYQFTVSEDEVLGLIIRNFGVALASTIAGVLLRSAFHQMRDDPADVEEATRLELAEAARAVRRELSDVSMQFAQTTVELNQRVREVVDATREAVDDMSREISEGLRHHVQRVSGPLESSAAALEAALDRHRDLVDDGFGGLRSSLEDETSALAATVARLRESLAASKGPDEVIQIKMTPVVRELTKAVKAFDEHAGRRDEAVGREREISVEGMERFSREVARLVSAVRALSRRDLREAPAPRTAAPSAPVRSEFVEPPSEAPFPAAFDGEPWEDELAQTLEAESPR